MRDRVDDAFWHKMKGFLDRSEEAISAFGLAVTEHLSYQIQVYMDTQSSLANSDVVLASNKLMEAMREVEKDSLDKMQKHLSYAEVMAVRAHDLAKKNDPENSDLVAMYANASLACSNLVLAFLAYHEAEAMPTMYDSFLEDISYSLEKAEFTAEWLRCECDESVSYQPQLVMIAQASQACSSSVLAKVANF